MKIYIAGASAEIDYIESVMSKVKQAGYEITFDWTMAVRKAGSASSIDTEMRRTAARDDLSGVQRADAVWVLQPESSSTGAWVELGYALALNRLVIVSGPSTRCIFSDLAALRFATHEEALTWILNWMPND